MNARINKLFYFSLYVLEHLIAVLTMVVLIVMLGYEVYKMFAMDGYFSSADLYLHNVLTLLLSGWSLCAC